MTWLHCFDSLLLAHTPTGVILCTFLNDPREGGIDESQAVVIVCIYPVAYFPFSYVFGSGLLYCQ